MSMAEFRRQGELTAVQAATAALADAVLGAKPPAAAKSSAAPTEPVNLADAADAMREAGLLDSPLGSNAWAFGKDTTANGSGLLLGNPHFPVGRRQPILAGAPDHPRQPGRHGRGHRQLPGCDHRLQQGRGLVAHRLHRQALHAARADAGAEGNPTSLPDRRKAGEDDVAHRQRAGARCRRQPADEVGHALVHPLGPGGGASARRTELDGQAPPTHSRTPTWATCVPPTPPWDLRARATCRKCARP
jgi:hypothetical protein